MIITCSAHCQLHIRQHLSKQGLSAPLSEWKQGKNNVDRAHIAQEWLTIKNTMWNLAGLIRSQEKLHTAMNVLRNLQSDVEQAKSVKVVMLHPNQL